MTKIYLIRHAESEGNAYRRAHGHFNGQIIDNGFKQIEALRKRFENEKIDFIYSSDLDRTCTTATALSEPRGLKINKTDMLREVCMGEWEDLAWGDIEHLTPDMIEYFNSDPAKWNVEGSEQYNQVQSRMFECLCDIGERHSGKTIAAFSHGYAIKVLICKLMGYKSDETHKVIYCDNTAVNLLTYENGTLTIEYQRDNSHLNDEISTFFRQSWWHSSGEKIKENLRYEQIDSTEGLVIFGLDIKEEVRKLDTEIVYMAYLDSEPVGTFALDSIGDENGVLSYYYIKPEHRNRNFLDQFVGQGLSTFKKLGKKAMQIEVAANDEVLISFFTGYNFDKVGENNKFVILEKKIT